MRTFSTWHICKSCSSGRPWVTKEKASRISASQEVLYATLHEVARSDPQGKHPQTQSMSHAKGKEP
eukprot:10352962-Prorocentrum_lima.AAC.1